jgi:beta-galactosidase
MNRKILSAAIICMLTVTVLSAQDSSENVHIDRLFNFGWKFQAGELKDAQAVDYDDSGWRTLDLPHDFQIEQEWDESAGGARGFKAMGDGWYRKSFNADPAWKGKRILLDFEGIIYLGDVWVNGEKVGSTEYGYLGFEADITKLLKYDDANIVAVYASTGKKDGSRWYTGGGLFRDVHLVVKDTISIARNGVFIATPGISASSAQVSLQVEIEGFRGKSSDLEIAAKIFSPDGKQVGETKTLAPKNSQKSADETPLPGVNIPNPQLWSCETPNLYSAEITLSLNGKIIDKVSEKFGIRTIEYSKEFGFKLNGRKVFLNGISNHHDLGAVGVAAYETAIARQMDVLKAFGFNHIRTSHNPYSKSFLRLADEKGILITDELYDKWSNNSYWGGRKPWTEIVFQHIPEWIKRDRNHPSVIMWSFGNELQMREDLAGFPTGDWGVTTYRMLDVLAKRYDPTRPTTVAMHPTRANGIGKGDPRFDTEIIPPELATVTDIASFNYRWMNYQDYLKHAPHMIIYQSEATTNDLLTPFFGMDRDRMVGLAYWGAIEYWGESHGWPRKGWNYSFFNHALEPFPQAYLMKSAFVGKPVVHIGIADKATESKEWNEQTVGNQQISSHWNRETGKTYNIYTYTNAEEVELSVNGKFIGIQKNIVGDIKRRNRIYWQNVPYQKGKIVAVARTGGKEVARHQLETTGKAVALRLEIENDKWKADGMDLQYVRVYAVDNKGRVVPTSEGEVTFDVSGAAKLIAVDNGDHSSDERFTGNKRQLHNGFALAVLRSTQTAGTVKIKATVSGLKTAECTSITVGQSNSAEKFLDGTPVPSWFFQTPPMDIDKLGKQFSITDYGVVDDSTTVQTKQIQAVIDKTAEAGGGVIVIPRGTFLSGSLFFKPKTHLYIEEGGTLKGSDDISNFPLVETRIEGQTLKYFAALVNADRVNGFTVSGKGTINGNGLRYWKAFWLRREFNPQCTNMDEMRPRLVYISNSKDVQLSGISLINSPFWTTHLYKCENVRLVNLYIFSPKEPVKAPSTDAVDIDACTNVHIKACYLSVNDDAVALKGGKGPQADKDKNNGANRNIIIEDCSYGFCHSVLTFGSESIHSSNIILRRCTVNDAQRLLWLKMRPDTPQNYENVLVEDITGNVVSFLYIKPWTQFFDLKGEKEMPLSYSSNVTMCNIQLKCDVFFDVRKSDRYRLSDFTFENLTIQAVNETIHKDYVTNFIFKNVEVNNRKFD